MIGELPMRFRAACHWRLYVGAIVGPSGLPQVTIPRGAKPDVRLQYGRQAAAVAQLRTHIFPDG